MKNVPTLSVSKPLFDAFFGSYGVTVFIQKKPNLYGECLISKAGVKGCFLFKGNSWFPFKAVLGVSLTLVKAFLGVPILCLRRNIGKR